jgi:hypothetical protein
MACPGPLVLATLLPGVVPIAILIVLNRILRTGGTAKYLLIAIMSLRLLVPVFIVSIDGEPVINSFGAVSTKTLVSATDVSFLLWSLTVILWTLMRKRDLLGPTQ